ncbi:type VI secretion system ImpA family N-terminal domain-containing protein [Erwinia papayae]|uniref:Type VI secretion system ImpA family N-terminal domain-containing protein n=2 Tax=Erwinia papayae TaxID=206499 RepID=A0ABV3N412_9GAMM
MTETIIGNANRDRINNSHFSNKDDLAMAEINREQLSKYYQHLLNKISEEHACGESLEYDPGFIMLQSRLQPRLNVEYGSFTEAAEPINWAETERECLILLEKSKDIRLVIALIRCRIRQIGLAALYEGLEALRHLLIAFPADLHPQLLDEDEFVPLLRANAFSELEDIGGLLGDIRNQPLPKGAGLQITIKDFEKGNASPREEGALPESVISALLNEWQEREEPTIHSLYAAGNCLKEIKRLLDESLGNDAPDFARLEALLSLFVSSSSQPAVLPESAPFLSEQPEAEPQAVVPTDAVITTPEDPVIKSAHLPVQTGIKTRSDAVQKLREIRAWFTKMEPSSPVIPLLAFAESTVGKSFSALLKLLPVDMIEKMNTDKE